MGKRQREYARKERLRLKAMMGGVCSGTGCSATEKLEFDCIEEIEGVDKAHWRAWDTSRRIAFYKIQFALDNLQLLCRSCHNKKTHASKPKLDKPPYEPTIDEDPQPKEPDPFEL